MKYLKRVYYDALTNPGAMASYILLAGAAITAPLSAVVALALWLGAMAFYGTGFIWERIA